MQLSKKVIVAVVVLALIAVIGLVFAGGSKEKASTEPTAAPEAAMTQEPTTAPEDTQEPETADDPSTALKDADQQAQDEAQDTMYEGALAGMTDEEIERQALAEEEQEGSQSND